MLTNFAQLPSVKSLGNRGGYEQEAAFIDSVMSYLHKRFRLN